MYLRSLLVQMKKLLLALVLGGCSGTVNVDFAVQEVGTDALLQAISTVDDETVWLSGHRATFVRTTDGGASWQVFRHPTGDSLQFRDIHAFDAENVVLMSAGSGPLSRIFKVKNGVEWTETFVMQDSLGFLDCMDFWDDKRGIAYGDAIDRWPYILLTEDGGNTWTRVSRRKLPRAGQGEGGFAASGSCVNTGPNGLAWIATGAGGNARILRTTDYGQSWISFYSPIIKGEAAGHTAVDFLNENFGFVTGGDLTVTDNYTANCAFSTDGGMSWILTSQPVTRGAFYGGTLAQVKDQTIALACGPNGMDYTLDNGINWAQLDTANYWAVDMRPSGIGWASGRDGRVVKIKVR